MNGNNYHCIKISSWNITGMRKVPSKRDIIYLLNENSEIIALQEVRSPTNRIPDIVKIPGYNHYFYDNEKPGYYGVAIFSKKTH